MKEQIDLGLRYARMLWRYRWLALAFSAVVSVAGWAYVIAMPNTYAVNAKVFVDTRSMLRPLLKGLAVDNRALQDSAQLMKRTLLTRPNLEEVARRTDLDLTAETPQAFEALVSSLAERVKLSGTSRDNVYEIKFEDKVAERAKRVVDELLNTFLETALGSSRTDSETTQKFLDGQIAEYERRLIEAEERLKEFKQKNVGFMPDSGIDYFGRMQMAKSAHRDAQLLLNEAVNRRNELRKRLGGAEDKSSMGLENPNLLAMSRYTGRIDDLNSQLDQLLLQYTDKHPDVVAIRQTLEDLETRQEEELKRLSEELANNTGIETEAVMTTKLAVAQSEAEVAALQARVRQYAKQVEELEELVDTVPEVEAELARLNRDYGLNKRQFDELLQRRESARMSEDVDEQAEDVKLKVIEPPRVPLAPSGPNRVLFFTGVLGASIGAGIALAFLLSQIQPRFYTSEELKEFTGLPILGSVSYRSSLRYRTERRMELAVFGLIFLVLLGVYGGLVSLESSQFGLHEKFNELVAPNT